MPQTREHVLLARQVGLNHIVVVPEQVRRGRRPGDAGPGRDGSARAPEQVQVRRATTRRSFAARRFPALNGDAKWEASIGELSTALDTKIPDPVRDIDKPFLMAVEDVFSIKGRGTVATGRVERGVVKVGEEVEIVGFRDTRKTMVTGVEMFRKLLDEGQAGDNIGVLLRGIEKHDIERGQVLAKPGTRDAAHEVRGRGVRPQEGGGRPSHAVLHELPPAVLHADDGRDRHGARFRRGPRWSCRGTTRR